MRKADRECGKDKEVQKQVKGYCMLKYAAMLEIWQNMRSRQCRLYFLPEHPVISMFGPMPMAIATSVMPGQPHRVSAIASHAN